MNAVFAADCRVGHFFLLPRDLQKLKLNFMLSYSYWCQIIFHPYIICPSNHLFFYCQSIHQAMQPSIYLSINSSTHPSIPTSLSPSIHQFIHPSGGRKSSSVMSGPLPLSSTEAHCFASLMHQLTSLSRSLTGCLQSGSVVISEHIPRLMPPLHFLPIPRCFSLVLTFVLPLTSSSLSPQCLAGSAGVSGYQRKLRRRRCEQTTRLFWFSPVDGKSGNLPAPGLQDCTSIRDSGG